MSAGIIKVDLLPGVWTQLPDQAANQVWIQSADYELAASASPGDIYFNVSANDGVFCLSVGSNGNLDSLWVRSQGNPVILLWAS